MKKLNDSLHEYVESNWSYDESIPTDKKKAIKDYFRYAESGERHTIERTAIK
jgi:predicted metalloendopeptidase